MKRLLLCLLLVSSPILAKNHEVDNVKYYCSNSDEVLVRTDWKQCVREGDWGVARRAGSGSYEFSCLKFAIKLNCVVKGK